MTKTNLQRIFLCVLVAFLLLPNAANSHKPNLYTQVVIQKSVNDQRYFEQITLNQIDLPVAWDITTGSNITIAVIDTGVNFGHEELVGKAWVNTGEIPNNCIDDDGNGFVDDYNGYNFLNNSTDISDSNGHGTGVASIISANTNNAKGIAGINWQASVMALKALNLAGGGEYIDVANALRYAVDNGADVINMSFGTYFDSNDLSSAVDYALDRGVPVIAAAGNNNQSNLLYPAGYDRVVAVGAVDSAGDRTSFSNYGNNLDVMAPGVNVVMAGSAGSNAYVYGSGTSFAAAHVTGVVSLMLARDPGLTPTQIETILENTTKGTGNVSEYGHGIVNAVKALLSTNVDLVEVVPNKDPSPTQPVAPPDQYSAQWVNQNRPTNVCAGEAFELWVELRNIGTAVWYGANSTSSVGQMRLGASRPQDRTSKFIHSSWLANDRVATTASSAVLPGQVGRFNFVVNAPTPGEYREYFNPVIEYVTHLPDLGIYWDITVVDAGAQITSSEYEAEVVSKSANVVLGPGETTLFEVSLKNTGSSSWKPAGSSDVGTVKLGTAKPQDRESALFAPNWLSENRVTDVSLEVTKNSTLNVSFTVQVPQDFGEYEESFRLVSEHITWFGPFITWKITVQ
ncbi:MAG: S8 family peptidase [Patescibacteria group bacterium]|nr:S8 family peptidase [Patescibacteria group bacterium]